MAVQGSQKFAVLLCKFKDTQDEEPFSAEDLREMIVRRGTGGLNDYWADASLGNVNLDGSQVFNWKVLNQKKSAFITANPDRWDKIQAAVDLFPEVRETEFPYVIVLYNVSPGDDGRSGRGVLGGPDNANVTWLAHETGHVMRLKHSYDPSGRKLKPWSQPGEYYDRYDIMSAMNVYKRPHDAYHWVGPLLNVANLDRMGWLPSERTWFSPSADRSFSAVFELVSLSCPEIPGFLAALVGGTYLEFRTQDRWDSGLPGDAVIAHRMVGENSMIFATKNEVSGSIGGTPFTTNNSQWEYRLLPGQPFSQEDDLEFEIKGGTRIEVESIDARAKTARVRVTHRVVPPLVAGPGQIFGGVASGGDGWLILPDGRRVPVPPHSPFIEVMQKMAIAAEAEQAFGQEARQMVTRAALSDAVASLQKVLEKMR